MTKKVKKPVVERDDEIAAIEKCIDALGARGYPACSRMLHYIVHRILGNSHYIRRQDV